MVSKISILLSLTVLIILVWWCNNSLSPKIIQQSDTNNQSWYQRIFVLGDSLSAWYRLPYEDSYPAQLEQKLKQRWYAVKVINGWESGDTSAWLKTRIDRITADAQSGDIALIVIWWNDGLQWLPTDALKQNIKDIVTILQSRNINTIIWWMQIPTNLWASYRSAFASLYPTVATETNSLLIPFILSGVAGIPELNLPDGIHPNTTGQAIVANTVFDIVIPLLQ